MLCSMFGKKSRIEDLITFAGVYHNQVNMCMQASLLASAALTVEVDTLKQNLERSEQELGLAKQQLEEKEGKKYLVYMLKRNSVVK